MLSDQPGGRPTATRNVQDDGEAQDRRSLEHTNNAKSIDTFHTSRDGAPTMESNHSSASDAASRLGAPSTAVPAGKRWWLFAAASALLLTILTLAAVYLVTKKPSTVDQLVILTVPSGAEVKL